MLSRRLVLLLIAIVPVAGSCGGSAETATETAPPRTAPPERFVWTDQPIVFAPPPAEWERHRVQERGMLGVSFQIPRVPAGRILAAEYYLLHRSHSRQSVATGRRMEFAPARPGASIEEVVDRVLFDPSAMPNHDSVAVSEMTEREIAGHRALAIDYTWNDLHDQFTGREIYVMVDDRLFLVSLLGTEDDLALFEEVVATVGFPKREAEGESQ